MTPELINGWYLTTDQHLGTSDVSGVTDMQKYNAIKIWRYFRALGWSESAIAGIIGNAHLESYLSPAYIQGTHRSTLPNSAASLSDVPNSTMLSFYGSSGYGVGLVQWDGYTPNSPAGQKLVSYAIRNSLDWYNGDTQTSRIEFEYNGGYQWQNATLWGTVWEWDNFIINTRSPEDSARIWQVCYEVADPDTLPTRQVNARFWYDYLITNPPLPGAGGNHILLWFSKPIKRGVKHVRI